ncbi:MAG: hypothetical protein A2W01_02095 [Candidatus Solincola sediminis]|nr:MAG: hypothetical protein A2W01_02095 [Candidatus Solincola sediminis]
MEERFEPLTAEEIFVDVVVPVYNEENALANNIERLDKYLAAYLPYRYRITIAENGSTDGTPLIAAELHKRMPSVEVSLLKEKGRGRALKKVWSESDANILAYMDVDLSTGLDAFISLIRPLIKGEASIAIGTRLGKGAEVDRSLGREIVSRIYNRILKWSLDLNVSDAQCGFKSIRADAALLILPRISDNAWFFDTELLAKGLKRGWVIHEVPVAWKEDKDSRVRIARTALDDLKGVARLRREFRESRLKQ